ncbi:MAG: DivIVA domain-containing protein [Solirubrobacteraceae bacterium]
MHDQIPAPLELSGNSAAARRDPEFTLARRGYERTEVDAYLASQRRRIDELEVMGSANAAVHQALERVGDEVAGILKTAHETADAITAQSEREAEDRIRAATADAAAVTQRAEQRVRELDLDTEAILGERERIVDDARELARRLLEMAQGALDRFPPSLGRSGTWVDGQ